MLLSFQFLKSLSCIWTSPMSSWNKKIGLMTTKKKYLDGLAQDFNNSIANPL